MKKLCCFSLIIIAGWAMADGREALDRLQYMSRYWLSAVKPIAKIRYEINQADPNTVKHLAMYLDPNSVGWNAQLISVDPDGLTQFWCWHDGDRIAVYKVIFPVPTWYSGDITGDGVTNYADWYRVQGIWNMCLARDPNERTTIK